MKIFHKKAFQKNHRLLFSLTLFYSVVLLVRSIGVTSLSDFFTSSSNDGIMQVVISLIFIGMIIMAFVFDISTLLMDYQKITFVRIMFRFFIGLLFINTTIYEHHAFFFPGWIIHLIFFFAFICELLLIYIQKSRFSDVKIKMVAMTNYDEKLVKKNVIFSILTMLFLVLLMPSGPGEFFARILMYMLLGIIIYTTNSRNLITKNAMLFIIFWIFAFRVLYGYLDSLDLVRNDIYILDRLTMKFAMYLVMFIPLFYKLFQVYGIRIKQKNF